MQHAVVSRPYDYYRRFPFRRSVFRRIIFLNDCQSCTFANPFSRCSPTATCMSGLLVMRAIRTCGIADLVASTTGSRHGPARLSG
jgi:hypothetical protein